MTPIGDEDIRGLDVPVDDAGGVSGIEGIGNLDGERQKNVRFQGMPGHAMLERHTVEKFHGDEGVAVLLADVVDGADIGVVQSGCGFGFTLKTGERQGIAGKIVGQKLKGDETMQANIFGFIDHAMPPSPSFSAMR
jgi:hypothetical protein